MEGAGEAELELVAAVGIHFADLIGDGAGHWGCGEVAGEEPLE